MRAARGNFTQVDRLSNWLGRSQTADSSAHDGLRARQYGELQIGLGLELLAIFANVRVELHRVVQRVERPARCNHKLWFGRLSRFGGLRDFGVGYPSRFTFRLARGARWLGLFKFGSDSRRQLRPRRLDFGLADFFCHWIVLIRWATCFQSRAPDSDRSPRH
jgi:hypothetical protein